MNKKNSRKFEPYETINNNIWDAFIIHDRNKKIDTHFTNNLQKVVSI